MGEVTTIGLDIAKSVFQIHGVDGAGTVVVRKRISRTKVLEFFSILPSCLVGIEACPSAHHWSRELRALGHTGWTGRSPAPNGTQNQMGLAKSTRRTRYAQQRRDCSRTYHWYRYW
jgi:hypothetical protein